MFNSASIVKITTDFKNICINQIFFQVCVCIYLTNTYFKYKCMHCTMYCILFFFQFKNSLIYF